MQSAPYTKCWNGTPLAITTDGAVSNAYSPTFDKCDHPQFLRAELLWDTGAIKTMISNKVAHQLGLIPVGMAHNVNTSGTTTVYRYRINLMLPNQIEITELDVISDELPDTDILIGMDVISLCDMAISHSDDKTLFSFQIPAHQFIDFTQSNNN